MRFKLLGIQVTKTLNANKKLVRRYALLMGSATTKRFAAATVAEATLLNGNGGAVLLARLGDDTEE